MARTDPRRIFVADYQALVVRGLVALLENEPDYEVWTGSPDPKKIVTEAIECGPELVILGLPANSGDMLRAAGRLWQTAPRVRIVALAEPEAKFDASALVRAGISGVVSRMASPAEVLATVRQGLAGKAFVAGEMASRLMDELAAAVRRADARGLPSALTPRELEVLCLVADGKHNREVANALHISENTVKNHMRSVHEKLGVRTRTQAVVTAARGGLLGLDR